MKIAVYTICKNEEKFAERYVDAARDADEVCILDTGSTDRTVEILRDCGATVHEERIEPWRFDTARNRNLELVSSDIDFCICVDMDEYLTHGWRSHVERAWCPGITRLWYWYSENDGQHYFRHHKSHQRYGYKWLNIVHEQLETDGIVENSAMCDMKIIHTPDCSKPRTQYIDLLKQHLRECPTDHRAYLWIAIQQYKESEYQSVIQSIDRLLSLNGAADYIRSYACSIAADACAALNERDLERQYICSAVIEDPLHRDPWLRVARYFSKLGDHHKVLQAVRAALRIDDRLYVNIADNDAWGSELYKLGARAAIATGNNDAAKILFLNGMRVDPNDEEISMLYAEFVK